MKTIYLIIIALMLIVVTPTAYACEGGGESEGGGEGKDSTAVDRVTVPYQSSGDTNKGSRNVRSGPLRGSGKPAKVDKNINRAIKWMNKHSINKPKRNPDIASLNALRDLYILSRGGSKALEKDRKNREPEDIMAFYQALVWSIAVNRK